MKEGIKTIRRNKERGKEKKGKNERRKKERPAGEREEKSLEQIKLLVTLSSVSAVPLHCFVTLDMLFNICKSRESHLKNGIISLPRIPVEQLYLVHKIS